MSNILSQNKLLTALGLTGCAFVGYAFYFDYKRTHAPDYKAKLRAKRKAAQKAKQPSAIPDSDLPDPKDPQQMQYFFMSRLQMGEELLMAGKEKEGIEHLAIAIVASPMPQQVLGILHQTLPYEHFQLLVAALPAAKQRLYRMFNMEQNGEDSDSDEVVITNSSIDDRIVSIDNMDELEDLE